MTTAGKIAEALSGLTVSKIIYDAPMASYASLKLGGSADALIAVESEEELALLVGRLRQHGIAFLPVGNLTNILVRNGGYRGALLWMRGLDQFTLIPGQDGRYVLDAQAGVSLGKLVNAAAAEGLTGIEFLAGIPGSAGGAVQMNAGAYGSDIQSVIADVTVIDEMGQKKVLPRDAIAFAYRTSNLPAGVIVCRARFVLQKGDETKIRARMAEILAWRKDKHPLEYPNAGSIFKNLPGLPAGRLIEEAGLKGVRRGDVQVSKKHANFMVNKGQGTPADMIALIVFVRKEVKKARGVDLELELVIIGEDPQEQTI